MRVYPLLLGEFEANEGTIIRGGNPKQTVWFSSYSFYIKGASKTTIVDTSFADPDFCQKKLNHPSRRDTGMSITERLEKFSLSPQDIQRVILTHCHWDHIGGLDQFPNATVYCQRDEVSWSIAPPEWLAAAYPAALSDRLVSVRNRLVLVDGDTLLEDGIFLRKVGAHSPGSQMVEVLTESGTAIITGDAIIYYINYEKRIPVGTYHNLHEAMDVIRQLHNRGLCDKVVLLPSHDPEVWQKHAGGV